MTDSWVYIVLFLNISEPSSASVEIFSTREEAEAEFVFGSSEDPDTSIMRFAVFAWDELPEWVQHKIAVVHALPSNQGVVCVDGVGGNTGNGSIWIDFDESPEFRRSVKTRQEQMIVELGISHEEE
jgi:hypothetical protein